jgi:nitrogen permease regulator 3-like protein
MPVVAPPPNPSLVAIILVIQARSGPRFVYHYPPSPLSKPIPNGTFDDPSSYEDSSDSDGDFTSTSADDLLPHEKEARRSKRADLADEEAEDSSSPESNAYKLGGWHVPWENLLGFEASSLERLLTPSDRSWHKRRFEVGFNELVFVGWPVFIREDGTWRKKGREKKASSDRVKDVLSHQVPEEEPEGESNAPKSNQASETTNAATNGPNDSDPAGGESTRDMTMFNVVFVLNPPILEYSLRVKEMYDHVVKKLGRALKWEQARLNYVWKQSEIILKAKAQARHKRGSQLFPVPILRVLK